MELQAMGEAYSEASTRFKRRVVICAGTGCMANGAMKVLEALRKEAGDHGLSLDIELDFEETRTRDGLLTKSGCQGFCQMGPLLSIEPDGLLYCKVRPSDVAEIVGQTLLDGKAVERLLYPHPVTGKPCRGRNEIPFYALQQRTVLKSCGSLDPEDIREYLSQGGYESAAKAYLRMQPEGVCGEILASGLRGRGGGGFPTGRKWEMARVQPGPKKYIVCNGDEGDPGAFMDRSVMEGNPHAVLEGMMIAARAIGADEGYVYVRAEYP
ncbi:MAG: NADH-quinone oxidoreductase subunit F, partial [Holophaga sp.]|nr:NADH-quinone oxidoreductase subunit F [Holophaga sp.]